jgi:hypothetical protein
LCPTAQAQPKTAAPKATVPAAAAAAPAAGDFPTAWDVSSASCHAHVHASDARACLAEPPSRTPACLQRRAPLLPGALTPRFPPIPFQALTATPSLSKFAHALEVAGLKPYLSTKVTRATIFAPTNAVRTQAPRRRAVRPLDERQPRQRRARFPFPPWTGPGRLSVRPQICISARAGR